MGRNIDEAIKALPRKRRERVESGAQHMALEMIRHADSLEQLRKAAGKTQTEVAQKLGIKQHAVSQLEKRADLYLSTLNRYVGALGHRLELTLITAAGERVELPNFHPWEEAGVTLAAAGAAKRTAVPRGAARKAAPRQNAVASDGEGTRKSEVHSAAAKKAGRQKRS